jgi:hypothetical protein
MTAITTDRFRCEVDRAGTGVVRRVVAVNATTDGEDVICWLWAAHIDGPMSEDGQSLWDALCAWTGFIDDKGRAATTEVTDQDVVKALGNLGVLAEVGHTPTNVVITFIGGDILLARGHNRDGWEAVLEDEDGNQQALPDGPDSPNAAADIVATWATKLYLDRDVM